MRHGMAWPFHGRAGQGRAGQGRAGQGRAAAHGGPSHHALPCLTIHLPPLLSFTVPACLQNTTTSPFSPQRGGHLLDADRLSPHVPPFPGLGGSGSTRGGSIPAEAQPPQLPPMAAAPPPADWLAEAFGSGMPPQQQQQQQQPAGRLPSWDEHAGLFVATPVTAAQPSSAAAAVAGQLPGRSPGGGTAAAAGGSAPQERGGGRSPAPSGPFGCVEPHICCWRRACG